MKLTFVIGGLAAGGTERQVALLANGLVGRGHQVQIVLLGQVTPADYPVEPQVEIVALGLAGWWRPDKLAQVLRGLRRHLTTADVVYSFLDLANALAALALRGQSVPLIWGWRASNRATGATANLSHWMCQRLAGRPNAAIANSPAVADFYTQSLDLGAAELPLHLVSNGVALATAATPAMGARWRAANQIPEHAFLVLCLSRAAPEKRQDLLLAAIAVESESYVVLAGRGVPQALAGWMPAGLAPERVRALEHVDDVTELFAAADVLVQVSDQEGQPNSLLEAMLSRVPVVASGVGGTVALLEDSGETRGWLVPAGDIEALGAAIEEVRGGGETLSLRVQCAADYVQRHHSPTSVVAQTEQIIEQVKQHHHQQNQRQSH